MVRIDNKALCCGCGACAQICPRQCIQMYEDDEGFLYPKVEEERCIDCDKCDKVCPELNQSTSIGSLECFAVKNRDDKIRFLSSSGGIFTQFANRIISEGGVVFGAQFNTLWEVVHNYGETHEDISAFRGSKYVQSRIGNAFRDVESFLKRDRKVLFTGTPCQTAALKCYLKKDYENLWTVDFICHGVPSPKIWGMYLDEMIACYGVAEGRSSIENINFRSKSFGWKNFSFVLSLKISDTDREAVELSSRFSENIFMRAFLSDLILRPSCYNCPAKAGKSNSDITIGDFWGIEKYHPDFDDDKGCSIILVNTRKGKMLFDLDGLIKKEVSNEVLNMNNKAYWESSKIPLYREFFFSRLKKKGSFLRSLDDTLGMGTGKRLQRKFYSVFKF